MDEAFSGIETSERKIHSAGPGSQKFLALFETATPHTEQSAAWAAAEAALPGAAGHIARRRDAIVESFWLEFALYAT